MSLAAAICSIVCAGIATGSWQTYSRPSDFQSMRRFLSILVMALLIAPANARAREVVHKGDIVIVPLRAELSPSLLIFLRRAMKVAESNGASAIIFEMNTYGGRLASSRKKTRAPNHPPLAP